MVRFEIFEFFELNFRIVRAVNRHS